MARIQRNLRSLIAAAFLVPAISSPCQEALKRPFTVADEIGLTSFNSAAGSDPQIRFSPDGKYLAIWSERGRLDINRVEDSLRFYRIRDVESLLQNSAETPPPRPVWDLRLTGDQGPVIDDWRWLADSTGVAFLHRPTVNMSELAIADVGRREIDTLVSGSAISTFDVRDRKHYIFVAPDARELKALQNKKSAERRAAARVGTGLKLDELLFPDDPVVARHFSPLKGVLWAVASTANPSEVRRDGKPITPEGSVALSPDGRSVVTKLSISSVPSTWSTLYPSPSSGTPSRFQTDGTAAQYVRIDLRTGVSQPLTDAPASDAAGWWWGGRDASWSGDGQAILLPGTFIKAKDNVPSLPCIAVVDLPSNRATCVEVLKRRSEETVNGRSEVRREEGYHFISNLHFVDADRNQVAVDFYTPDSSRGTAEYRRTDGRWQVIAQTAGQVPTKHHGMRFSIKQAFDEPPKLIASDNKDTFRVVWDPNPQLKDIVSTEVSIFRWKDKNGREWKGGLYKPLGYSAGKRFPLVIQTHGFDEDQFRPSGIFPSAFAARALAASGMLVVQIGNGNDDCTGTPEEGPCGVAMLEGAANQLVSQGLADPERIGAVGFSRTGFQVMEELTTGSLHLRAASVTDSVMFTYLQFLSWPERFGPGFSTVLGAPPVGEGLQQWLKRSPGFNLDKVRTPLLVNAEGTNDILFMWEPYAGLRYLHKPVDLIVLNTDEHVLTNPAVRMASQGGSVDWFRFWLQGYEDPDPAKAEQYKRWRGLKKMQDANERKSAEARSAAPTSPPN